MDEQEAEDKLATKSSFKDRLPQESVARKNIVYPKVVVKDELDADDAIYERMVILIPYKAPDMVK